jgi:transposase-like protein
MKKPSRRYSAQFKQNAVNRMADCANVSDLANELGIRRKFLYLWREQLKAGGLSALERNPGRPRGSEWVGVCQPPPAPSAEQLRIAELERLLGRKQAELEFLKKTFEHVRAAVPNPTGAGVKGSIAFSTPRSRSQDQR